MIAPKNVWLTRSAVASILLGGLVIWFGSAHGLFYLGAALVIAGVSATVASGQTWRGRLERAGMAMIALGILMIVQGFEMQVFGAGFVVTLAGTVLFSVVSHLEEPEPKAIEG